MGGLPPPSQDTEHEAGPLVARPIGVVRSSLGEVQGAPRQADEGAPGARIVVDPAHRPALDGLRPGDGVVVLTWLHLADRTTLRTRPRDDPAADEIGVFATRSPHRPNPIGLHEVTVVALEADGLVVDGLEAIDGTPVLDLKCTLGPPGTRG